MRFLSCGYLIGANRHDAYILRAFRLFFRLVATSQLPIRSARRRILFRIIALFLYRLHFTDIVERSNTVLAEYRLDANAFTVRGSQIYRVRLGRDRVYDAVNGMLLFRSYLRYGQVEFN